MADEDIDPRPWAAHRMQGGDWVDPKAVEEAAPRADRTISVRLTEAELAEFDAQIARLGLKRNRALRIAARRIAGFVEADPAEVEALRDATRQLGGVARNVNQIAGRRTGRAIPSTAPSWRNAPRSGGSSRGTRRGSRCCSILPGGGRTG